MRPKNEFDWLKSYENNLCCACISRGALQRRVGDFNAAIDDFLLALDKTNHDEESNVYVDAQRQLLLTYNDFAVECFSKTFYEEAVILLNKAIKGEKKEKGLYINRGGKKTIEELRKQ